MKYIETFFKSVIAILAAITMAFAGYNDPGNNAPFEAKNDDVLFNVTLLSDVHVDSRDIFLQTSLRFGMLSLKKSETPLDAIVIAGDLTTYGDRSSLETVFKAVTGYAPENVPLFITTGNHDIGHSSESDITEEEARQNFIELSNQYLDLGIDKVYFSREIKGYTFITLSDESDDSWDRPDISDEQLSFLDSTLAAATAAGDKKPVFVVCHWPITETNGQEIVWPDCAIGEESDKIQAILEKYSDNNIFYISGHIHTGVNSDTLHELFDVYNVEEKNGIFYVNLPAYGSFNRYGVPWPGTGMQMEVYENEVLFRPRSYLSNMWYSNHEYSVTLHK